MKLAAQCAVTLLLTGCVPLSHDYLRIEVPDARRFKAYCHGGAGAPSTVYFPFNGAYVSLSIDGSVSLSLHLPAGMSGQLNDDVVRVAGRSANGPVDIVFHVKPERGGPELPREFTRGRDACELNGSFGPFVGETTKGSYLRCTYISMNQTEKNRIAPVPQDLIDGTVQIPSITINGVRYPPQTLPFKRAHSTEISPINC